MLDESNRKPNNLWLDKDSKLYNRSMKSFLQNKDTEIHSTHNENLLLLKDSLEP